MTIQTYNNTQHGLVKDLRKIRDQISNEINDMTFDEERIYLDKLLAEKRPVSTQHQPGNMGAAEQSAGQLYSSQSKGCYNRITFCPSLISYPSITFSNPLPQFNYRPAKSQ